MRPEWARRPKTQTMRTLHGLDGLRQLAPGSVVSIGNFDGLHVGHRAILQAAAAMRRELGAPGVAVATFEPHPFTVLRPGQAPPRLTPPNLKRDLLAAAGVDDCAVLPPVPEVLNLTAENFWAFLRDEVRPAAIVEGETFTFGKARGGDVARLRQWTRGTGVQLRVVPPVTVPLLDLHVVPASSSLIRWLLANGRSRDAAICLGRAYALEGEIVKGHQRGRTIGVPTANLDCSAQHVPADGVYAARCDVDGATYPVALSIGTMPTFGANARQVEAHLIGFDGDLYGKTLRVEVIDWLRGQAKYANLDALKAQIALDVAASRERVDDDPARGIASVESSS